MDALKKLQEACENLSAIFNEDSSPEEILKAQIWLVKNGENPIVDRILWEFFDAAVQYDPEPAGDGVYKALKKVRERLGIESRIESEAVGS